MRAARIIEIYHIELRLHLVLVKVLEQFVVGDDGEVIELVVIQV